MKPSLELIAFENIVRHPLNCYNIDVLKQAGKCFMDQQLAETGE